MYKSFLMDNSLTVIPVARSINRSFFNTISHNDIKGLKILLNNPKINPADANNYAIRYAAENGQTEIVKLLLSDDRVDPSADDNEAIRYAAKNGHTEIVKILLQDDRVNPSSRDNYAIRHAARNGHSEIVKILLKIFGVTPIAYNNEAIISSVNRGHNEVVKILLNDIRIDPIFVIELAAQFNNIEIVKLLLQDPRPRVNPPFNALKWAAQNGNSEIVELLLSDGRIDPSANDNEAIKLAALYRRRKVIKLLLQDPRVDWRVIKDNSIVQKLLYENNNDIESKLTQSYLSFTQAGPKKTYDEKDKSIIPKKIRRNVAELGVYQGFYEEYCSNVPENLKIPPMKLILIADRLKIEYNKYDIDLSELCAKVRIRLNHFLD